MHIGDDMAGTSIRVKESTKEKLINYIGDESLSQEQMIIKLIEDNTELRKEVKDLKKILTNIDELKKEILK